MTGQIFIVLSHRRAHNPVCTDTLNPHHHHLTAKLPQNEDASSKKRTGSGGEKRTRTEPTLASPRLSTLAKNTFSFVWCVLPFTPLATPAALDAIKIVARARSEPH